MINCVKTGDLNRVSVSLHPWSSWSPERILYPILSYMYIYFFKSISFLSFLFLAPSRSWWSSTSRGPTSCCRTPPAARCCITRWRPAAKRSSSTSSTMVRDTALILWTSCPDRWDSSKSLQFYHRLLNWMSFGPLRRLSLSFLPLFLWTLNQILKPLNPIHDSNTSVLTARRLENVSDGFFSLTWSTGLSPFLPFFSSSVSQNYLTDMSPPPTPSVLHTLACRSKVYNKFCSWRHLFKSRSGTTRQQQVN